MKITRVKEIESPVEAVETVPEVTETPVDESVAFAPVAMVADTEPEAVVEKVVKEKKPKGPVVVISSAIYGTTEKNIEAAEKMIVGRKITNKLVGEDPAPKLKKILIVKATVDGNPVEKTFNEGDKLLF